MNNTKKIVSHKLKTEIDAMIIPDTQEIQSRALTILDNARQIIIRSQEDNKEDIMAKKTELETGALAVPETGDLDTRSSEILTQARAITIQTSVENEQAAIFLRGIKTLANEIEARFKPAKDAAHAAHRQVCALEKEHMQPLKDAEAIVKKVMTSFMVAAEQRRIREQEKLNAESAEQGAIAPVIEKELGPEGISLAEVWGAEVVDFMAVVRAAASGKIPTTYLLINQTLLDQQARALKNELRIPGVKVWNTRRMSARKMG